MVDSFLCYYFMNSQMDIRRATWFMTWKSGVELQLYEFQLAQSQKRLADPLTQQLLKAEGVDNNLQDGTNNDWEEMDFDLVSIDTTMERPRTATATETLPSPLVPQTMVPLEEKLHQTPFVASRQQTPGVAIRLETPCRKTNLQARSVTAEKITGPSPAVTFMQARPGGPVQTAQYQMKVVERRILSQIQKKAQRQQRDVRHLLIYLHK